MSLYCIAQPLSETFVIVQQYPAPWCRPRHFRSNSGVVGRRRLGRKWHDQRRSNSSSRQAASSRRQFDGVRCCRSVRLRSRQRLPVPAAAAAATDRQRPARYRHGRIRADSSRAVGRRDRRLLGQSGAAAAGAMAAARDVRRRRRRRWSERPGRRPTSGRCRRSLSAGAAPSKRRTDGASKLSAA